MLENADFEDTDIPHTQTLAHTPHTNTPLHTPKHTHPTPLHTYTHPQPTHLSYIQRTENSLDILDNADFVDTDITHTYNLAHNHTFTHTSHTSYTYTHHYKHLHTHNHHLQAIEENSLDMLDNTDFEDTDIPVEIPLPEVSTISVSVPCVLCVCVGMGLELMNWWFISDSCRDSCSGSCSGSYVIYSRFIFHFSFTVHFHELMPALNRKN